MACHEIAALRLGLMGVLGIDDAAEREHELAELGACAHEPGPLRALSQAQDLALLQRFFEAARADLDRKTALANAGDPKLPYLRTLVVMTKQVEFELQSQVQSLTRLYADLERMHDFVHEMYPPA